MDLAAPYVENMKMIAAVTKCDSAGVAEALRSGADPDCEDGDGLAAAFLATMAGDPECFAGSSADKEAQANGLECLRMLLAAGADPRVVGNHGRTMAMEAASRGRADCLRVALSAGVDVDARDFFGVSPAMAAAGLGHADCLAILISAGADLSGASVGFDAEAVARRNGNADCLSLLVAAREARELAESCGPGRMLAKGGIKTL